MGVAIPLFPLYDFIVRAGRTLPLTESLNLLSGSRLLRWTARHWDIGCNSARDLHIISNMSLY
jgi:hypothetical protein